MTLLFSTDWQVNYAALVQYGEEYGHCNILQKDSFECILPGMGEDDGDLQYKGKLGVWLNKQRQAKKGHINALKPEREALLQTLVDQG